MSRISSCPKCARLVTLPQGADPEAQVRCPLCTAEYRLADAMAGMPPELMLVGASAMAADRAITDEVDFDDAPLDLPDASAGADVDDDLDVDTEIEIPDFAAQGQEFDAPEIDTADPAAAMGAPLGGQDFFREAPEIDDELELDDGEPTPMTMHGRDDRPKDFNFDKPGSGGSPVIPPAVKPSRARRRKEPSAIGNLIGVVGGGIVGLSLGYLALLWIGGPDKDFVKVGDKLPGWMLPASFQKQRAQAASNQSVARAQPGPVASQSDGDIDINVPPLDDSAAPPPDMPGEDSAAASDATLPTDVPSEDAAVPSPFDDPSTDTSTTPATTDAGSDPVVDPFATDVTANKPAVSDSTALDPFAEPAATTPATDKTTTAPDADAANADSPVVSEDPFAEGTGADVARPATDAGNDPKPEVTEDEKPAATDASDPLAIDPLATEPSAATDPVATERPATDAATEKPAVDPIDSIIGDSATDAAAVPAADVPAPSQPKFALVDPATPTPSDASAAMKQYQQATQQLENADSVDKKALSLLISQQYVAFFRLAEIDAQSADDPAVQEAISQQMSEATGNEKKIAEIAKVGANWLRSPKRGQRQGVLLTGTAEQIDKTPSGYTIQLRVSPAQQPVMVVTPDAPGAAEGDRVILTGNIIDQPQEKIAGYSGDDGPVIWLGRLEKLPPATE